MHLPVRLIDGSGFGQKGGGECVVGDVVDESGKAARGLEEDLDNRRREQRHFAASEKQVVSEVVVVLVTRPLIRCPILILGSESQGENRTVLCSAVVQNGA